MRTRLVLAACLALSGACLPPTPEASARRVGENFDLSMRRAAYFNFKSHAEIDLKGRRVAAGGTVHLKKAANTSCEKGECRFAVGLFVFRNLPEGGDPGFEVSLVGETTHTLVFGFAKGEKIKVARHETPPLKMGENKLKVVLDPENKFAEADEANNSFEFTVVVVENE